MKIVGILETRRLIKIIEGIEAEQTSEITCP